MNKQPVSIKKILHCLSGMSILVAATCFLTIVPDSCSQQNMPDTSPASPQELSIRVNDGGYNESVSGLKKGLGSKEVDYRTHFTAGDAIGVYAIDPKTGNIYPDIQNLKLTAADKDGQPVWETGNGKPLLKYPTASYYAYYPYKEYPGFTPSTPSTPAKFFEDLIANWIPTPYQGDQKTYSNSDLMIAQGSIGKNNTLNFTMTHQMELMVIELPQTIYQFTNNPKIPDYKVNHVTKVTFNDKRIPYKTANGSYRYLVNPKTPNVLPSGSFNTGETKHTWSIPSDASFTPTAGQYDFFEIDEDEIKSNYKLSPGDYLLKDGNLLPQDTNLSDDQKKQVVGIVLQAGKDASDQSDYKQKDGTTAMPVIHGYAVALFDADGEEHGAKSRWSSGPSGDKTTGVGTSLSETDFMSYSNTQAIKDWDEKNGKDLQKDFPACYYATDAYEKKYPAPDNSSGWFFPSAGQLKNAYDNKEVLNKSLSEAGGQEWQNDWYWSSSEYSDIPADFALEVTILVGDVLPSIKTRTYDCERALVAF